MKQSYKLSLSGSLAVMTFLILAASNPTVRAADPSFIGPLTAVTTLSTTVPPNGDVNPYGMALVPRTAGKLVEGHILISNFNSGANTQGTGPRPMAPPQPPGPAASSSWTARAMWLRHLRRPTSMDRGI